MQLTYCQRPFCLTKLSQVRDAGIKTGAIFPSPSFLYDLVTKYNLQSIVFFVF